MHPARRAATPAIAGLLAVAIACAPRGAAVAAGPPATEIVPDGRFLSEHGASSGDLSGIACLPPRGDERTCLVVDDEARFAQLATLRDRRLVAGRTLDLIGGLGARLAGDPPPPGVFGTEAAGALPPSDPRAVCPHRELGKDFDELDGEGVAWAPAADGGGWFYVVGSHACGRHGKDWRRSTHLLARFRVDRAGVVSEPAELTWRLGEALGRAEAVGPHYGLLLDTKQKGLDIEGITARGDELLFGLRAPSLHGEAFVLTIRAAELFGRGPAPTVRVARLALGKDTGIRDLAALPDGRLLVLTGAAEDQKGVDQGLALVVPSDRTAWPVRTLLPRIDLPRPGSKAEGLAVLGTTGNAVTALVVFEAVSTDHPRQYEIPLPP